MRYSSSTNFIAAAAFIILLGHKFPVYLIVDLCTWILHLAYMFVIPYNREKIARHFAINSLCFRESTYKSRREKERKGKKKK